MPEHLEILPSIVERFIGKELSEKEFIQQLRELERFGLYFAHDKHIFQIKDVRNPELQMVLFFDPDSHKIELWSMKIGDTIINNFDKFNYHKKVIAFSGSARSLTNDEKIDVTMIIKHLLGALLPSETAVLTGGYPDGVPKIAAQVGRHLGFDVLGIAPAVIFNTNFTEQDEKLYTDFKIYGNHWGEESDAYGLMASTLVFIKGGEWTRKEHQIAKMLNRQIFHIDGFGGFSGEMASTASSVMDITFDGKHYRMTADP